MGEFDVIVVGAGAAGLMAAHRASRLGARTLVLEKTPRAGTKILASGGTHCNLTTTLDGRAAARLFGPAGERFLRGPFQALSPSALRAEFETWGVPTRTAPMEKVFPISGRARDVRDALLDAVVAQHVVVRYDEQVGHILDPQSADAPWGVRTTGSETLLAQHLILAPGGKSYPLTGTTGDGYDWLKDLELPLVRPRPSLVPLSSEAQWVRDLAGVSLQDCELILSDSEGQVITRRRRPLLFTHRGLSGPGPMDLSGRIAAQDPQSPLRLRVDLLPDADRESLRTGLLELAARSGRPSAARLLRGLIPKRLVDPVFSAGSLPADVAAASLSRAQRHGLIETIKGLPLPVAGTLGYDQAEVTSGGLALSAVDPRNMQVRGRPRLYVCGELLDLDGPIGGLNFQSAFATGHMAGLAAGRSIVGQEV